MITSQNIMRSRLLCMSLCKKPQGLGVLHHPCDLVDLDPGGGAHTICMGGGGGGGAH